MMAYNLTIGELKVSYYQDEDEPRVELSAESSRHDEAPAFGEISDYTNGRYPSYSAWYDFTRSAGLFSLFYGKEERYDALLANHPGCVPLTEQHRREVNKALVDFKLKYPDAIATYKDKSILENGLLCRLVWFHYWVNWALDNCKQPVFENS